MSEQWTLKGKIVVNHLLPELHDAFGTSNGVAGITVKVSARSKILGGWGTWSSWGKVTTGADGSFRVAEKHGGDRRQFRVEILFDSDRLRIKEGQETSIGLDSHGFPLDVNLDLTDKDWHEVHNDKNGSASEGRKAGMIDLGSIFATGTVRKHADLWFLYNKVLDLLKSYGADFAFKKKVVVKYPMGIAGNSPGSASYSNPVNGTVYIKESEFFSKTAIHELMHQWEFERSSGEDSMAWQLAKHGDTHQARENTTFVPSYEAFAEWASYKILKEITDGKLSNFTEDSLYALPDLPLSRSHIGGLLEKSERFLSNVDYTEHGWHSLFNILTYPFLDRCDFNKSLIEDDPKFAALVLSTVSCPEVRTGYSLKDVLGIYLKHPSKGVDDYLKKSELNFGDFLHRAGAVLPGLDSEKIKMVKNCLDPNSTSNPCPH